jgi:hypothetical protein
VGANVSSEINTAIVTIDLGTINTGSGYTNKLRAAILCILQFMPWFKVLIGTDWFIL